MDGYKQRTEILMQRIMEEAYFEGQKDAINQDIRIEKDEQGTYHWAKSCWDDGTKPIFDPAKNNSIENDKTKY